MTSNFDIRSAWSAKTTRTHHTSVRYATMACAKMFDDALSTADCKVAEKIGGNAMSVLRFPVSMSKLEQRKTNGFMKYSGSARKAAQTMIEPKNEAD